MSDQQRQEFFQFNLGHLITLLSIVGSAFLLYGQRERDRAVMQTTIEAHTVVLKDHGERLTDMDRQGTMANTARNAADHNLLVTLTTRVDAQASTLASALAKIDPMATDVAWIKAELLRLREGRE
jgi:hypothetical protein